MVRDVLKEEDCAKLCAGGFAEGCWSQGDVHFEGRDVPKNLARGLELFKKACDGGSTNGCTALALAYNQGRGVAKDLSAARTYFKKAGDGGYGPACTGMTNIDCVQASKTPRQRRVGDDAKCAAAKGHRANSRIVNSSKTYVAYEAPDNNSLQGCFSAMVSEGCYQVNIQARDTSICCCP